VVFYWYAVTNPRQLCNRLHHMQNLMKPLSIEILPELNNIDMTESSCNVAVVTPVTQANNQEIISPEQMIDDYKD